MTTDQLVLAVAGTLAIAASLLAMVATRPRPANPLEALYLVVPVIGVMTLVFAVARG